MGLLVGFILTGTLKVWSIVCNTFYDIKITDIAQLLVTAIIGIYVAYYINIRTGNEQKQKEIILELVEEFAESIKKIHTDMNDYIKAPKQEKAQNILRLFKTSSIFLSILLKKTDIKPFKGKCKNNCKELFYDFKACVTEVPFNTTKPNFSYSAEAETHQSYSNLVGEIYNLKLNIYS
jgi:hypothetical protein